jgi:hypothetical protein
MPSFSQVVKDHKELKSTLMMIEQVKKKIRDTEKGFNPPEEFALRSNETSISMEPNPVKSIIDNLEQSGVNSEIVLLNTMAEGVKSSEFNPPSALQLWQYIWPKIKSKYTTKSIADASQQLSDFLNKMEVKKSYSKSEMKTIESYISVILNGINQEDNPSITATDLKTEIAKLVPQLSTALLTIIPTPPAGSTGPSTPPPTTPVPSSAGPPPAAAASSAGPPPAAAASSAAAAAPVAAAPVAAAPTGAVAPTAGPTPTPNPTAAAAAATAAATSTGPPSPTVTGPSTPPPTTPVTAAPVLSLVPGAPVSMGQTNLFPVSITTPFEVPDVYKSFNKEEAQKFINDASFEKNNFVLMKQVFPNLKNESWDSIGLGIIQNWYSAYYILGQALNIPNNLTSHVFQKTPDMDADRFQFFKGVVNYMISTQQTNMNNGTKKRPDRGFLVNILNNTTSPITTPDIMKRIYPDPKAPESPEAGAAGAEGAEGAEGAAGTTGAAGNGFKRGRGLRVKMEQLISRTENLISAAQLGNKTTEVFNELDTNLSVLIDKKKITKKYRDNLMKNLFH